MATLNKVYKPLADRVKLVQKVAKQYGFKVQINSGYRSSATQAQIAKEGNRFPVASPGKSQHQYGYAVDLQTVPWSLHAYTVGWMQEAGIFWAGDADPVHFSVFTPSEWALRLGYVESNRESLSQNPLTLAAPTEVPTSKLTTSILIPAQKQPVLPTSSMMSGDESSGSPISQISPIVLQGSYGGAYMPIWGYTQGYGTDSDGNWNGSLPPKGWKNPVATYVK